MNDDLLALQEAAKETYTAILERDYNAARSAAQRAGTLLEHLEGDLEEAQEEARVEALSALGDGMQARFHGTEETQGVRAFGRVVSNSRIILQRQLSDEEYTFDEVAEE